MKKKILITVIMMIGALTWIGFPVNAGSYASYENQSPYYSYEYNAYGELSSAPDGYIPDRVVFFDNLGIDMTDSVLSDIFFDGNQYYVLDSGLGRILILNKNFKVSSIINGENIKTGRYKDTDTDFKGALGLFVEKDGRILICDTEHERILMVKDGVLCGLITRPETTAVSETVKFDVKKIVKTSANYYVVVESVVSGVMVFDEDFNFIKLFGSNNVVVTSEVLLQQFQNLYMSDEQIAARRKFSSSKINGIDLDRNGFVVVISSDPELTLSGSAVRCLNFKGGEVNWTGDEASFGDKFTTKENTNAFSDISIDEDNFYVLLDTKYGRIFVYSEKGLLVSCFGGIGTRTGLFGKPTAVTTVGEKIVVLDENYNAVTVFKPTEYGRVKRDLISVIDGGNAKKIKELTGQLLKYNTNCQYAPYAGGFVAEQSGDYATAMKYYKLANDRASYGQAFKLYRTQFFKDNIVWIFFVAAGIITLLIFGMIKLAGGLRKPEGELYCPLERGKVGYPIFCLFHPADGFWQIKIRDVLSPVWLVGIFLVFVYVNIAGFLTNGFLFNENRASDFNIIIQLAKTAGVILLFLLANWSICTIMDGKGTFKEILYTVMYGLLPYVISQVIATALTHVLTSEEAILITVITSVGAIWSGIVLFVGLLTIHEYSVGKAIFSLLLTVIGMAIILLLIVLFYILIGQTVSFVQSLIQEYTLQH